jgi:hypothetical protein
MSLHIQTFVPQLWQISVLVVFIIPLLFTIAGWLTFDYSSVKEDRTSVILLNVFIVKIILFSAVVS